MPRAPQRLRPYLTIFLLPAAMALAEEEPVLPSVLPEGLPEAVAAEEAMPAPVAPQALRRCGPDPVAARWFDRAQGYFSQRACTPATWFDRFFGGERTDDQVASALIKVVPSVQFSEQDFTDSGVSLHGRVNLPNLRDRLNIVINEDADEQQGLLRGEVQRPQQANASGRESTAALRYLFRLAGRSGADIDVGLRSQAKFYTRARYYYGWQHSPVLESRITQSLYFRDGEGFGETTRYEVERMLAEDMMLRWTSQATVSEKANGLEFRDGVQVLRQIDRRRAISWGVAMTVNSDPAWKANAYASSVRFRQQAFRPWLFFEVEPFIDAARVNGFTPNPGIAFRMEIWLGDAGSTASTEAPVAPPAEPVQPAEPAQAAEAEPGLPSGLELPPEPEQPLDAAPPAENAAPVTSPADVPPTGVP